jgi:16S rRNA (cytosine967-C5)-methyltransferase
VNEAEVERLSALQGRMLDEALRVVAPGGTVVYSVCTVTRAETVDIAGPRGGGPVALPRGENITSGTLLSPHQDGTDGMFISRFRT